MKPLSFYVHVPYCSSRCGYCDFNTYTADEFEPGIGRSSWLASAMQEADLARERIAQQRPLSSIFFGGGTPTLLPAADLVAAVEGLRQRFGFAPEIEITTEANPDSVDADYLSTLRAGGFTRISFGMQSTSNRVLQLLDRTHTPGRAMAAVEQARAAGFEHINLDLIYGTPGETMAELEQSVSDAMSADVDHISAYSLTIEPGTKLGALNRRGEFPSTDEDDLADKYQLVDGLLGAAGFDWYEISNWARPGGECRHNLHYWRNDDWWGIGPGAHSHLDGLRFWNRKHPVAWSKSLAAGELPWEDSERLTESQRAVEHVMLSLRLATGMPISEFTDQERIAELVEDGMFEPAALQRGRLVLSFRGRLLADRVIDLLT